MCFMMKDEESISDLVSDFSVDLDNYDQLLAAFKKLMMKQIGQL